MSFPVRNDKNTVKPDPELRGVLDKDPSVDPDTGNMITHWGSVSVFPGYKIPVNIIRTKGDERYFIKLRVLGVVVAEELKPSAYSSEILESVNFIVSDFDKMQGRWSLKNCVASTEREKI